MGHTDGVVYHPECFDEFMVILSMQVPQHIKDAIKKKGAGG